tara:strand:- start:233 stop:553 length:321 start_codon:yes stop_codon:yes gene_type:complete
MKIYWLIRYYLKLGSKNINFKINIENTYSSKELIKNDVILQLSELVEKYTDFYNGYVYKLKTKMLTKNLWLCQLKIKEDTASLKDTKINLIYKLGKSSNKILLLKF